MAVRSPVARPCLRALPPRGRRALTRACGRVRAAGARAQGGARRLSGASEAPVPKPLLEVTERVYAYVLEHTRESEAMRKLREDTVAYKNGAQMQIPPEQGVLLQLMIELMAARKIIEVGVYTGYSALAMASAATQPRVLGLESDARPLELAAQHWERADVRERITVVLGDAADVLRKLVRNDAGSLAGHHGDFDAEYWATPDSVDLVFIDANKRGYAEYVELAHTLVRPGGLVVLDDVLWKGKVADYATVEDKTTQSIRDLNAALFNDDRWTYSLLPVGDGLALCRKR